MGDRGAFDLHRMLILDSAQNDHACHGVHPGRRSLVVGKVDSASSLIEAPTIFE